MGDDLGFTYVQRKGGGVAVSRGGKLVTVLRGATAARFLAEVDGGDAQQVMARVTGNYRRGNERTAGEHPRNRR